MAQYIYSFENGDGKNKKLLGGKGANLCEMKKIGLPVPDGFTITTEACTAYYTNDKALGAELEAEVFEHINQLEKVMNKTFGSTEDPLLVSVRSGAAISMPGMMDTVLNLGLNDDAVIGLAKLTENERFAYDCYRRFIQMFSDVVLEIQKFHFDRALDALKTKQGVEKDVDLTAESLKALVETYKEIVLKQTKQPFPQDPKEQLLMAIEAVFRSWNNNRAIVYRNLNNIPHNIGTAVNVQSMVFGNMGDTSGTGVAFTRNPSTGENAVFGEFLMNAQGEDVVAGIRTPQPVSELEKVMPEVYGEFMETLATLEHHYLDMQDVEFTIERSKLYFLQTRTGKRTAKAAMKIAVDMVSDGIISKEEAIMRVDPKQIDALLHPTFDEKALEEATVITKGLPASPGAASGRVFFNSEDVVAQKEKGVKTILVRTETSPEDIEGMVAAEGIITARGGMTSHAAVVARGMGKCCVAGCGDVRVDEVNKVFYVYGTTYREGDFISVDGNTGTIYEGQLNTREVEMSGDFGLFMSWADEIRTLKIRTNADNPRDSRQAVDFGAEGIGLCRTEHMFFEEERIPIVREMILSKNIDERQEALERLLPFQKEDFIGIFEVMAPRPVTIRLLDPPLHEFLPHLDEDIEKLAEDMRISFKELKQTVEELKEFNPMLGHRGCRLAITYPEIYEMQARAIFEAVVAVVKSGGETPVLEVMIPLVGHEKELSLLRALVIETGERVLEEAGLQLDFKVGTMIEVPRAALIADDIAKHADFFSFGTNDLTQMTLGFSRDDAGKFIGEYIHKEVFERDPFASIDIKGVGKLMRMAKKLGRSVKPDLKLGICGEHGGEPDSIAFCHELGFDYVSCSPFRVPIARLAAAQAAIREKA
ncbi:MAG: pyruvate, phosphate dikinase [Clostridia bacterium]|nr:pyruvate, phosphate dikinase [Clostridia bacterium]